MKKIAIISKLPSGGARNLYDSHLKYIKRLYTVTEYRSPNAAGSHGILKYYKAVIDDLVFNYKISKEINSKFDLLIAYQSWLTKSPLIFPLINIPIVYICNEVPREHYDPAVVAMHSIKDRIVNKFLLLPIKILDRVNILFSKKNIAIITLSKSSRELIEKVYKIKAHIIHPGIKRSRHDKYIEISERNNQVISVGSINKLKNQKFLLEVVERIPLNLRPKLILVGNGGDKKYIQSLREYAKSKSINLKIYCDLSRKRLIDLYKHSYVFMYAPINEPYGLVVLEAIKAGLPLMVSNSGGGYNEVIDKNNGYILRNDSDLWARTYVKLLSNHIEWKKLSIYNYDNSFKYSDINYHTKLSRLITKYL